MTHHGFGGRGGLLFLGTALLTADHGFSLSSSL
jgi:hypothetical protein